MGVGSKTKTPEPKGARVEMILEQTDSPLALFFVVAIRWAAKSPKSFHVTLSLAPPVLSGNS
jgi:hypothetical protein